MRVALSILSQNYDAAHDVLYLGFADRQNSYGDEVCDDVIVLKDADTEAITGVTILDFLRHYRNDTLCNLPVLNEINFERDVIPQIQNSTKL